MRRSRERNKRCGVRAVGSSIRFNSPSPVQCLYSSCWRRLTSAVSGRDDAAVFRGAAEAIEHAPGREGNLADGLFAVALVGQKCRHHANHIGTAFDEDDTGIIANRLQRAWL